MSDNPRASASDDRPSGGELDSFAVAASLLRHLRLVAGLPLIFVVLLVIISLLLPRQFTVETQFIPSSQSSTVSQLVGLAAQLGLTSGGGGGTDASDSPDFYSDFIKSNELLQGVARQTYHFRGKGGTTVSGDLALAFGVDSGPPAVMIEKAATTLLNRHLSVDVTTKTGVVNLAVNTTEAALSVQIAQRIVDEVNRFNREVRQSQAGQERQFIQTRLDSAVTELRQNQDRMEAFLRRNRDYSNSPALQFEHDRILQDITTSQTLYTSLLQSFEQARMEEVRTTPVITVVVPPVAPARPDSRHLPLRALLVGVFGLLVAILGALGLDELARRRAAAPTAAAALRDLWEVRWAQLRALGRSRPRA